MAYVSANLSLLVGTVTGNFRIWVYRHTDTFTTVKAANYISDAVTKGMNVRDLVIVEDTTSPATTLANILTNTADGATTMSQTGVAVAE